MTTLRASRVESSLFSYAADMMMMLGKYRVELPLASPPGVCEPRKRSPFAAARFPLRLQNNPPPGVWE